MHRNGQSNGFEVGMMEEIGAGETALDVHLQKLLEAEARASQGGDRAPSKGGEAIDYLELLQASLIDPRKDLPPPPICLTFAQGGQETTIGTLGNFSMVIGKAKSRKTFLVATLLAAWARNGLVLGKIGGKLPVGQRKVLHFDTEQGQYHVLATAKRVLQMAGPGGQEHYHGHALRRHPPHIRLGIIEAAIYADPTIGVVVIDGIRDLSSLGINDEEEATALTSKLLKWTEERQIHVVVVLHQNKNDQNARGHLGTELVNKAETVLSVAKELKDRNYSNVHAEYCRDIEPEPFLFFIDEEGLPQISEQQETKPEQITASKKLSPMDIPIETHRALLKRVFAIEKSLGYEPFWRQLKLAFQFITSNKLSDNQAKQFPAYYHSEKLVHKEGQDGSRNVKYFLAGTGLAEPV